jgi:hypothetical protein
VYVRRLAQHGAAEPHHLCTVCSAVDSKRTSAARSPTKAFDGVSRTPFTNRSAICEEQVWWRVLDCDEQVSAGGQAGN